MEKLQMNKKQKLKADIIETLRRWIDVLDIECKLDLEIYQVLEDMITWKTIIDGNKVSVESLLDGA